MSDHLPLILEDRIFLSQLSPPLSAEQVEELHASRLAIKAEKQDNKGLQFCGLVNLGSDHHYVFLPPLDNKDW